MRATASVGILAQAPDGRFAQTPMSALLRTGAVPSLRHVAMFLADEWHVRGLGTLAETVRTGQPAPERLYGVPSLFEYFARNPEAGATFHRGMTDLSTLEVPPILEAYDFSGIGSIVDVGGGHGFLLAGVLQRHPAMKGILYEAPPVIDTAPGGPTEPVKDRVTFVKGNMFESAPAGADAYMMKHIIHDWPDDICIGILKHCRAGVNPGGKLLVIDPVVPSGNEFHVSKFMDLEMMLFPGGKERTEEEFRGLLAASGWRMTRIVPTRSYMSIIEGVPA